MSGSRAAIYLLVDQPAVESAALASAPFSAKVADQPVVDAVAIAIAIAITNVRRLCALAATAMPLPCGRTV